MGENEKVCPSGKTLYKRTNRCRKNKVQSQKKVCPSGKTLYKKTNRCRKNKVQSQKKVCPSGKTLYKRTNRCRKDKPGNKGSKPGKGSKPSKGSKPGSKGSKPCRLGIDGEVVYDVKANGVLLAMVYKGDVDIDGWWASEKWDGYRAVWNGKSFVSRAGKNFDVPDWYCSIMPPGIALDGELWLGREKFEDCGLFRKKKPTKPDEIEQWENQWKQKNVKYKVFDILNNKDEFEERMKLLQKLVKERNKCARGISGIVSPPLEYTIQTKVSTEKALSMAKDIIKKKGEGIMLRKPKSLYEAKRSKTLYKIKETDDMEAIIVGYKPGKGKYSELLGAFRCSLVNNSNITFNVSGMKDDVRKSYKTTHPIGTMITITYNGLTSAGIPRHPRYLRIRHAEGH